MERKGLLEIEGYLEGLLSVANGNLHYFQDLERGNPYLITTFP
ncbi:MAG: hypothetical protein WD708_11200 [Kiritimatiellia bacterium]